MSEVKVPMNTFKVIYECDHCCGGELIFTGYSTAGNPPIYAHQCNLCDHSQGIPKLTYPQIEHVPIQSP